ncbi:hypothetical protein OIU93_01165 [Paeniglutamicibacter sp. ZC-3]|uniref:hypothetical protein n=1 Tax=Paeniglutamicibacter sp. ZC-3 TaxID=2986919 RepID=UPI0021F6ED8C|nr:hypothetical protein [Paeniglutamicibacter sp. ZC-3]MCV9992904.1 hypothetical protein [Paeniglutamicibacter sp. ZC-3]
MSALRIIGTGPVVIVVTIIYIVLLLEVEAVRLISAVVFSLFVPGYGWALRMRPGDGGDTLAMALVLSLCATTFVATAMAVAGWWSPVAGFISLLLMAAAGFVRLRRDAGGRGIRAFHVSLGVAEPRAHGIHRLGDSD